MKGGQAVLVRVRVRVRVRDRDRVRDWVERWPCRPG